MKTINNFINEKLQLNSQSKLTQNNWTIEDAKEGDILTFKQDNIYLIFIFSKFKNTGWNNSDEILAYACYNVKVDWITIDKFHNIEITTLDDISNDENVYLSNDREKQFLFDELKKKGYMWDPNKKEFIKL